MRLTPKFYIGDKDKIVGAVANEDFSVLEELEDHGAFSDFDIHISPDELNHLFKIFITQLDKNQLEDNLNAEEYYFAKTDQGNFCLKDSLKNLIASCSGNDVHSIAKKWYNNLSDKIVEDSTMVEKAITDLVKLSKIAVKEKNDLVQVWFA